MQNRTTLLTAMALTIVTGCGGATESQIPSSGDSDAAAQDSGGSSSDAGSSSGGDSATATTDATTTTQGEPTWTYLVNTYLSGGKVGNCTRCHSQFSTPPKAYTYLSGKGYIKGASSPLVSTSQSCLSWYSGTMPPGGPTSVPAAVTDFNAWAAAGAKND
ncbi:MAG: hypothetical protein ABIP39_06775 [Polyangiaceae bacterium]